MHLNEKSMQSGKESLILFSIFNSINKPESQLIGLKVEYGPKMKQEGAFCIHYASFRLCLTQYLRSTNLSDRLVLDMGLLTSKNTSSEIA